MNGVVSGHLRVSAKIHCILHENLKGKTGKENCGKFAENVQEKT